ncbi:unnamed protein product [Clavelina lepadiformis]|uniref:Uncharacterized protein n=1 Tax=Clavelina lepadiformis TaxID=159417 RepID=A0ABP0FAK8_CLALP
MPKCTTAVVTCRLHCLTQPISNSEPCQFPVVVVVLVLFTSTQHAGDFNCDSVDWRPGLSEFLQCPNNCAIDNHQTRQIYHLYWHCWISTLSASSETTLNKASNTLLKKLIAHRREVNQNLFTKVNSHARAHMVDCVAYGAQTASPRNLYSTLGLPQSPLVVYVVILLLEAPQSSFKSYRSYPKKSTAGPVQHYGRDPKYRGEFRF